MNAAFQIWDVRCGKSEVKISELLPSYILHLTFALLCLLPSAGFAQSLFDPSSVAQFDVFTTAVSFATDVGAITLSATADDWDWSGVGWINVRGGSPTNGCLAGCNLVTDLHALAGHCLLQVGDVMHFRSPDGTKREATVAAREFITSGILLVRFSSAPHATLARYPVIISGENLLYRHFWTPQKNGDVAMRKCSAITSGHIYHTDGGWGLEENSSGKPSLVPFDDGTFGLFGIAHYVGAHDRVESYITEINVALALHSEELSTVEGTAVEIPDEENISKRLFLIGP